MYPISTCIQLSLLKISMVLKKKKERNCHSRYFKFFSFPDMLLFIFQDVIQHVTLIICGPVVLSPSDSDYKALKRIYALDNDVFNFRHVREDGEEHLLCRLYSFSVWWTNNLCWLDRNKWSWSSNWALYIIR